MEQTLCKAMALICIRSCFVIHPGAKAILFGSTRRTLVTVGECYLSLYANTTPSSPLLEPLSEYLIITPSLELHLLGELLAY